jgi:hypothetical protein
MIPTILPVSVSTTGPPSVFGRSAASVIKRQGDGMILGEGGGGGRVDEEEEDGDRGGGKTRLLRTPEKKLLMKIEGELSPKGVPIQVIEVP